MDKKNKQKHLSRDFIVLFIFLLIVLSTDMRFSVADIRQVTSVGRAVINGETTLGQAKNNALNQARIRAVEQAAGVSVSNLTLIKQSMIISNLVRTFSHGFLVEESVLEWQGGWLHEDNRNDLGFPVVNVRLTGKVEVLPTSFFRNHVLSAKLDKKTYRSGESAMINVKTNEDIFLLVANYTSKNNILPVYPNTYQKLNFIRQGTSIDIPAKRQTQFKLLVKNYAGHRKDVEAFLILGFPVDTFTQQLNWHELFEAGKEIDYSHFFERIMALPIRWIAEKTLVYTVVNQ